MAGAMEKSTDVMKAMQSLMKVGEVRETMMALSKEMSKVGWEWSYCLTSVVYCFIACSCSVIFCIKVHMLVCHLHVAS